MVSKIKVLSQKVTFMVYLFTQSRYVFYQTPAPKYISLSESCGTLIPHRAHDFIFTPVT